MKHKHLKNDTWQDIFHIFLIIPYNKKYLQVASYPNRNMTKLCFKITFWKFACLAVFPSIPCNSFIDLRLLYEFSFSTGALAGSILHVMLLYANSSVSIYTVYIFWECFPVQTYLEFSTPVLLGFLNSSQLLTYLNSPQQVHQLVVLADQRYYCQYIHFFKYSRMYFVLIALYQLLDLSFSVIHTLFYGHLLVIYLLTSNAWPFELLRLSLILIQLLTLIGLQQKLYPSALPNLIHRLHYVFAM